MLQKLKQLTFWLLATFLVYLAGILLWFWLDAMSFESIKEVLPIIAKEFWINPVGWLLLLVPYTLNRLMVYLYRSWKKNNTMTFLKRCSFVLVLPVFFVFSGFKFSKWYTQSEEYNYQWQDQFNNTQDTIKNRFVMDGKQRGMHLFSRREMGDELMQDLLKTNMEWITLVPFGWQKDHDSESVGRRDADYSTWTRRDSSFMNKITALKKRGFYIQMKPHIWMNTSSGKWRSDIMANSEEGWNRWSESYRQFIFHYAKMSELFGVELLCIGTELQTTVKKHPHFWEQLITDIRKIYSGKITYAANWNDEIKDVKFWGQLDYIGIQAYFPLTNNSEPSIKELKKGWRKHLSIIKDLHQQYQKPVLFSELGYKSTPDAAIEPWAWADNFSSLYKKVSYKTQANCYEAFFQTFWKEEWFAGVHFWEWQADHHHDRDRDRKDINFTPQQKPAENIMTKWFAKTVQH